MSFYDEFNYDLLNNETKQSGGATVNSKIGWGKIGYPDDKESHRRPYFKRKKKEEKEKLIEEEINDMKETMFLSELPKEPAIQDSTIEAMLNRKVIFERKKKDTKKENESKNIETYSVFKQNALTLKLSNALNDYEDEDLKIDDLTNIYDICNNPFTFNEDENPKTDHIKGMFNWDQEWKFLKKVIGTGQKNNYLSVSKKYVFVTDKDKFGDKSREEDIIKNPDLVQLSMIAGVRRVDNRQMEDRVFNYTIEKTHTRAGLEQEKELRHNFENIESKQKKNKTKFRFRNKSPWVLWMEIAYVKEDLPSEKFKSLLYKAIKEIIDDHNDFIIKASKSYIEEKHAEILSGAPFNELDEKLKEAIGNGFDGFYKDLFEFDFGRDNTLTEKSREIQDIVRKIVEADMEIEELEGKIKGEQGEEGKIGNYENIKANVALIDKLKKNVKNLDEIIKYGETVKNEEDEKVEDAKKSVTMIKEKTSPKNKKTLLEKFKIINKAQQDLYTGNVIAVPEFGGKDYIFKHYDVNEDHVAVAGKEILELVDQEDEIKEEIKKEQKSDEEEEEEEWEGKIKKNTRVLADFGPGKKVDSEEGGRIGEIVKMIGQKYQVRFDDAFEDGNPTPIELLSDEESYTETQIILIPKDLKNSKVKQLKFSVDDKVGVIENGDNGEDVYEEGTVKGILLKEEEGKKILKYSISLPAPGEEEDDIDDFLPQNVDTVDNLKAKGIKKLEEEDEEGKKATQEEESPEEDLLSKFMENIKKYKTETQSWERYEKGGYGTSLKGKQQAWVKTNLQAIVGGFLDFIGGDLDISKQKKLDYYSNKKIIETPFGEIVPVNFDLTEEKFEYFEANFEAIEAWLKEQNSENAWNVKEKIRTLAVEYKKGNATVGELKVLLLNPSKSHQGGGGPGEGAGDGEENETYFTKLFEEYVKIIDLLIEQKIIKEPEKYKEIKAIITKKKEDFDNKKENPTEYWQRIKDNKNNTTIIPPWIKYYRTKNEATFNAKVEEVKEKKEELLEKKFKEYQKGLEEALKKFTPNHIKELKYLESKQYNEDKQKVKKFGGLEGDIQQQKQQEENVVKKKEAAVEDFKKFIKTLKSKGGGGELGGKDFKAIIEKFKKTIKSDKAFITLKDVNSGGRNWAKIKRSFLQLTKGIDLIRLDINLRYPHDKKLKYLNEKMLYNVQEVMAEIEFDMLHVKKDIKQLNVDWMDMKRKYLFPYSEWIGSYGLKTSVWSLSKGASGARTLGKIKEGGVKTKEEIIKKLSQAQKFKTSLSVPGIADMVNENDVYVARYETQQQFYDENGFWDLFVTKAGETMASTGTKYKYHANLITPVNRVHNKYQMFFSHNSDNDYSTLYKKSIQELSKKLVGKDHKEIKKLLEDHPTDNLTKEEQESFKQKKEGHHYYSGSGVRMVYNLAALYLLYKIIN